MRPFYAVLSRFAAAVAFLLALGRALRDPLERAALGQRLGFGVRRAGNERCVWLHAVSLGEVNAIAPLVAALRARRPNTPLLLTTATATGRARAQALFAQTLEVRYLPYDTPGAVRRFLRRVRPALGVILETELWPNLMAACRAQQIPLLVASARMTPRSLARYLRVGRLFREAVAGLAGIAAQSEADARRFIELGAAAGTTQVMGNLKFEIEPPAGIQAQASALRAGLEGHPLWVAGSTHEGEETIVLEAHRALREHIHGALLVLAPRHPQRFARVAQLLQERGVRFVRRSSMDDAGAAGAGAAGAGAAGAAAAGAGAGAGAAVSVGAAGAEVLLLDRIGELMIYYAASDAAFVGGSLVPVGGHNLLEPAVLGVPVLTGPYTANSGEIAAALLESGAARLVRSAVELTAELRRLLAEPEQRAAMGALARGCLERHRGSLARLLVQLEPQLEATVGAPQVARSAPAPNGTRPTAR